MNVQYFRNITITGFRVMKLILSPNPYEKNYIFLENERHEMEKNMDPKLCTTFFYHSFRLMLQTKYVSEHRIHASDKWLIRH